MRLREILQSLKGGFRPYGQQTSSAQGPVWQDEWFDHVIRSDESLAEKVQYIAENPVRKGIATSPREYPWFWADPGPSNYTPKKMWHGRPRP